MRTGCIGLGSQGAPMARRIVQAGYATTLWVRRPKTLEPFADTGADVAASPAELAKTGDFVCVSVANDADVEEVIAGEGGVLSGLGKGGVIAVHSTIHPDLPSPRRQGGCIVLAAADDALARLDHRR